MAVHHDCGDGGLILALGRDDSWVVQGLSRDTERVERCRRAIESRKPAGNVTVRLWQEEFLPYSDDLVNLFVADSMTMPPMPEVMRVLAPHGVACIKHSDGWRTTVKADAIAVRKEIGMKILPVVMAVTLVVASLPAGVHAEDEIPGRSEKKGTVSRSREVGELLRILTDEKSSKKHLGAIRALKGTDDERAIPVLDRILEREMDPVILITAAEVLADMKNERRIPLLLKAVQQYRSAPCSTVAVNALAEIDDERVIPVLAEALVKARVTPRTIVTIEVWYRQSLIRALARRGGEEALAALMKGLRRETVVENKVIYLKTLAELGDKRALPTVVAFLDDAGIHHEMVEPRRPSDPLPPLRRGFPYNTRVGECALWAACTIRDGEPPFPIQRLVGTFREKDKQFEEWEQEERRAIKRSVH
jgi:hypothetical protein